MENASIELHDSRIAEIIKVGDAVVVQLPSVYLHKSTGRPGIDSGTGWIQAAKLSFRDAVFSGNLPELPCDILNGDLILDEKRHENMIPVPLDTDKTVQLHLVFDPVHTAIIEGTGVRLELLGEAQFVEKFKPHS